MITSNITTSTCGDRFASSGSNYCVHQDELFDGKYSCQLQQYLMAFPNGVLVIARVSAFTINKLRFYLYDNMPVDFTDVNKRRTYSRSIARTLLWAFWKAKAIKQLELPLANRDSLREYSQIMTVQKQHRLQSKRQRDNGQQARYESRLHKDDYTCIIILYTISFAMRE